MERKVEKKQSLQLDFEYVSCDECACKQECPYIHYSTAIPPPPAAIPPAPPPPPQPHALVLGNAIILIIDIIEEDSLAQILYWIGLRTKEQRQRIIEDCFNLYDSIQMSSKKDIDSMAVSFASRTAVNGRIIFETGCTKQLIATTHWILYFNRISKETTILGLNERQFKNVLGIALTRANICKTLTDPSSN